jgi:hypothetical protein
MGVLRRRGNNVRDKEKDENDEDRRNVSNQ